MNAGKSAERERWQAWQRLPFHVHAECASCGDPEPVAGATPDRLTCASCYLAENIGSIPRCEPPALPGRQEAAKG